MRELDRSLDDVVETIRHCKEQRRGCSLLIGAGCSVTAGIPTAGGFVDLIRERYPAGYDRANPKSYAKCMAELANGPRQDLVAKAVDDARINWGHIGIAQLIRHGYVDRVLTTNFDPLVLRACALVGDLPAVYDFAASQLLKPEHIPPKAIFHLHGQRRGFILLNTEEEVQAHSKRLGPLFAAAGSGRLWIVVGYSGENDPVFDHLASVPSFEFGLYWVGFRDHEPAVHLRDRLLLPGKAAYYVRDFEADSFFVELTRRLRIFPPDLVRRPFTHLASVLEPLTGSSIGGTAENILATPRRLVNAAIREFEDGGEPELDLEGRVDDQLDGTALLMAGKFAEARHALKRTSNKTVRNELAVWSYFEEANALAARARRAETPEATRLLLEAGPKYAAVLTIKAESHEALNSWGNVLAAQAKLLAGANALELFARAEAKYAEALTIKPDRHEVFSNWGNALLAKAQRAEPAMVSRLLDRSREKYEAALKLKPNWHIALFGLGTVLAHQADRSERADALCLWAEAEANFAAALTVKPDSHDILYNWGNTLLARAMRAGGAEAGSLLAEAGGKYAAALAIKPDMHAALANWGTALSVQASGASGLEALALHAEAGTKYAEALKVKPDSYDDLKNWRTSLIAQARLSKGVDAESYFAKANAKYDEALARWPDSADLLNAWGGALLFQAAHAEGVKRDHLICEAEEKIERAYRLNPSAAAYNRACIAGIQGNEDVARERLWEALKLGALPDRQHLESDADLAELRRRSWFRDLLIAAPSGDGGDRPPPG